MGELIDTLDQIHVECTSPSGAVTAIVTRQSSTRVSISSAARQTHDDDSLAEEIEAAVTAAWSEIQYKLRQKLQELRPNLLPESPGEEDGAHIPEDLKDAIENIDSQGLSDSGYVEAFMSDRGRIFINFLKNALRRTDLPTSMLESEIETAIRRARRGWVSELKKAHQPFIMHRR